MIVYADILLALNLLVNYFLVLAAGRLCRRRTQRQRMLAAAALGALYATILFVKGVPAWALLASRLLVSALMVRVAYSYICIAEFLREYIVFFAVNFIFAGSMLALWLFVAPSGMLFRNGIVYFHISAVMLVAFTAFSYAVTELLFRIFQKQQGVEPKMYDVTLELGSRQTLLTGFLDTGNTLKDVYTGYPVAICSLESVRGILPSGMRELFCAPLENLASMEKSISSATKNSFKMIPYHTVGYNGLLPAFRPDRMMLEDESGAYCVENIYIAVAPWEMADGEYEILLGPEIFPLQCHTAKKENAAKTSPSASQTEESAGNYSSPAHKAEL